MVFQVKLLTVGALIASLQGLYCIGELYDYKVYSDKLNYTDADYSCQDKGRRLVQVNDVSKLNYSQSKSSRLKGEKFWMGLKVDSTGTFKWSTGIRPTLSKDFRKIVDIGAAEQVSNQQNKVYCFLVTNDDLLQMENCTEKHYYICGQNTVTSISSDAAAPIKSTVTNTVIFTSQSTSIATERTILTDTADITPTKTILTDTADITPTKTILTDTADITPTKTILTDTADITPTKTILTDTADITPTKTILTDTADITPTKTILTDTADITPTRTILTDTTDITPTGTFIIASQATIISPTSPMSPETQIQEYITKIHMLRAVNEDSLQIAVNETSELLTRLHGTSYYKTLPNVLPAAQQLEEFAALYAAIQLNTNDTSNSTKTYKEKNFDMMVRKINAGIKNDVTVPYDGNEKLLLYNTNEKIILPEELFKAEETVVVGIIYKNIHLLLPDESHAFLDGKKLKNAELRTRVIACSIAPRPPVVLEKNVTILFTLDQPSKTEDRPHCVFWDFNETTRFNGSWSSKGCSVVNSTDAKVVCTCNHLTNFAVLMQIGDTKIPVKHQVALEVITYIGCGLSLLGEVLTVIVYMVFMNFKQEQCQIRLNLVVSIAIAQIIFLAGIDATAKQGACIFVAVTIHYFYLAGFAWMLMEGIYLYLMVVKVFNTLVKMKLFYAFSWGFPCLMVVLSLVIASGTDDGIMSYVHSDFCWVSFSNNLVWTFAAPVLVVSLVNSVILCCVVCELTKMQAAKDISNIKQGLKACVVLFPLLGMTWVFGVLSVTDAGLVFQYIFTVLNSLQGFFIFVMHVFRSSEVRTAYLRKREKWNTTKNSNFPISRSAIDASADVSEKHTMKTIRGSTESPDPLYRRHQVSPMNSDINTRESCLTPVDS